MVEFYRRRFSDDPIYQSNFRSFCLDWLSIISGGLSTPYYLSIDTAPVITPCLLLILDLLITWLTDDREMANIFYNNPLILQPLNRFPQVAIKLLVRFLLQFYKYFIPSFAYNNK